MKTIKKLWRDVQAGDRVVLTVTYAESCMDKAYVGGRKNKEWISACVVGFANYQDPDAEVEVVESPKVVSAIAMTGDGREVPSTFQKGDTVEPFDPYSMLHAFLDDYYDPDHEDYGNNGQVRLALEKFLGRGDRKGKK